MSVWSVIYLFIYFLSSLTNQAGLVAQKVHQRAPSPIQLVDLDDKGYPTFFQRVMYSTRVDARAETISVLL